MSSVPARVTLRQHKDRTVLALDTGHAADSLEGLRLVKASRGTGWLWRAGNLSEWETRGVLQESGRLVIWGETSASLEGLTDSSWETSSEAWLQTVSWVNAWTSLALKAGLDGRFEATSVLPLRDGAGWAWAFVPRELASVLTSVLTPEQRHRWSPVVLPEGDPATWAFASASLLWRSLEEVLPWTQEDEAFQRQEMRELGRTLSSAELPQGLDTETQGLWLDSLGTKPGSKPRPWRDLATRWQAWAAAHSAVPVVTPRPANASRTRQQSRKARQFWRRRGTVVLVTLGGTALVLSIVGSIVWGILKPDPSDTWTQEQVVNGYYHALSTLDAAELKKLIHADRNRFPEPAKDEDVASNLFVLVQVRTSYEHKSPLIPAETWVALGKPPLALGQMLFGLTDLDVKPAASVNTWTAEYVRWTQTAPLVEGQSPESLGEHYTDRLSLEKTWKGWKIAGLVRSKRPLP